MIVLEREPLWKWTTLRAGGPADRLVFPESPEELAALMERRPFILGGGSNLLVADAGIRGDVVCLAKGFARVEIVERRGGMARVYAGAGARLARLAAACYRAGLTGMEFAHGIPGLVGGALIMNAGTGEGEMKDVVELVTVMERGGAQRGIAADECGFAYRGSALAARGVVTGAFLRLREGERETIRQKMRRLQRARMAAQPLDLPSAGSVFKNPPGESAWRLIAQAGLRGARVGGAQVSEKHANFIVNTGGATAKDVVALMETIERRVEETSGVTLEREIRLAGDFGADGAR